MLAAGRGRRMGGRLPKYRLAIEGTPMVVRVLRALGRTRAAIRGVVLRRGDREGALLVEGEGASAVFCESSDPPLSTSVHVALGVCPPGDATLFALADQPFLETRHFDALIDRYLREGGIAHASYAGRRGSPALFGPELRAELLDLEGPQGGREVIQRHPELSHPVELDPAAGRDVDRPRDLQRRGSLR